MFIDMIAEFFRTEDVLTEARKKELADEAAKSAASLEEKRKRSLELLGNKWILHPDNRVKKQEVEANVLDR